MENQENKQEKFAGLSDGKVEWYSSLNKAIWSTALSIGLLIIAQLLTHCGEQSLENKRRESELIKQALTPGNKQAEQNLIFLVRSGLVDCEQFKNNQGFILNQWNKLKKFLGFWSDTSLEDTKFTNYQDSLKEKTGQDFKFTDEEKKCNLIQALVTAPPRGFGNQESGSNELVSAEEHEALGWSYLIEKDIEKAKESFQQAYNIYPRLHSIDEILQLLMSDETDKTKLCVIAHYKIPKLNYSWKAPKDLVKELQSKHDKDNCQAEIPTKYKEGFK